MLKQYTDIKCKDLRGGSHTNTQPALIPFGGFSYLQNVRGDHPGFSKRMGQRKLNTTASGTNKVLSLYQYSKSNVSDDHFYAQFSDGNVAEYSSTPPTTVTGTFGSTVFTSSSPSDQISASWSVLNDILIYSNGYDQHQIYGGKGSYVDKFIVVISGASYPVNPEVGKDYSDEVRDDRSANYADCSNVALYYQHGAIYIKTATPAKSFTFTLTEPNLYSTATISVRYFTTNGWLFGQNIVDGTFGSSRTLNQNGTVTFDKPYEDEPKYMFASNGYWYMLVFFNDELGSAIKINTVTYESAWKPLLNMWDGIPADAVEAQVYDGTGYSVYGGTSIDVGGATTSYRFYFASADPINMFYIDPGLVPNTNALSINAVWYWNGMSWAVVSSLVDNTNGMKEPGWVTFTRPAAFPQQFRGSQYFAYWYFFTVSATVSDDTNIGIQTAPYFDVSEMGYGQTNCVWKDRACYSFTKWPSYVYISQTDSPYVLNGFDYGILQAGDGRANSIVAMRKFYNELLVWQEEKGPEGGCLTLFEGYSPATFGKLLLSSKIGAMNNKSVVVVDGVLTATATDERIKTLAFFLSRYGVGVTDGRTVSMISDDIGNYFDTTNTTDCIRRGYEQEMWLNFDSTYNVLRLGLVTGTTATGCNTFPVYDLVDKCWYFDTPYQELNCMCEVGATSGNVPILQYGGGLDDGTVYQLNYGNNDYNYPINAYVDQEFDGKGEVIQLRELVTRNKADTTGTMRVTVYNNGIEEVNKNLTLQPEKSDEVMRRHRENLNVMSKHITIRYQNDEIFRTMSLLDMGIQVRGWLNE